MVTVIVAGILLYDLVMIAFVAEFLVCHNVVTVIVVEVLLCDGPMIVFVKEYCGNCHCCGTVAM